MDASHFEKLDKQLAEKDKRIEQLKDACAAWAKYSRQKNVKNDPKAGEAYFLTDAALAPAEEAKRDKMSTKEAIKET